MRNGYYRFQLGRWQNGGYRGDVSRIQWWFRHSTGYTTNQIFIRFSNDIIFFSLAFFLVCIIKRTSSWCWFVTFHHSQTKPWDELKRNLRNSSRRFERNFWKETFFAMVLNKTFIKLMEWRSSWKNVGNWVTEKNWVNWNHPQCEWYSIHCVNS